MLSVCKNVAIVASGDSAFSMTNALDCTVYLLDGGSECALIDAGSGVEWECIAENIRAAGIPLNRVRKILLTHGHGDHAGGAAALAAACGATVYAMEPAAQYVAQGDICALSLEPAIRGGVYPPGYSFSACPVHPLQDGEALTVGQLTVHTVASEGHSAGHCCYTVQRDGETLLFAGDAVQCGGKIALQPIWDCDLQKYTDTVYRLAALHPDILLPAHGAFALQRGWQHLARATAALDKLTLPKNSIGE